MDVNSLIIAIIALVPTIVFAIFVEKHFAQFWTSAWNMFAVALSGGTLLLIPYLDKQIMLNFGAVSIPLGAILIGYAIIVGVIGFKFHPDALKIFGNSKVTAGILIMTLISQYFFVNDILLLISIAVGIPIVIWVISDNIKK